MWGDQDKNLREVIVKYSGDIDGLQIPGMEIQKASGWLCNCKASGGSDRSARGCPGDRICGDAEKSADRFV